MCAWHFQFLQGEFGSMPVHSRLKRSTVLVLINIVTSNSPQWSIGANWRHVEFDCQAQCQPAVHYSKYGIVTLFYDSCVKFMFSFCFSGTGFSVLNQMGCWNRQLHSSPCNVEELAANEMIGFSATRHRDLVGQITSVFGSSFMSDQMTSQVKSEGQKST